MTNKIPRKKLSKIVRDYLPEFVRSEEEYETFVAFMEAFYEYLETTRGQTGSIRNLRSLQDIDQTLDEFVNSWQDILAEHLPASIVSDKRLVLKKMKDVYLSKGTEKSYKLLFRILFNEDIEIRYPGEQVLIASGGDWRESVRLDIVDVTKSIFELEFTTVRGESSGAKGIIERIERTIQGGEFVWRAYYSIESKEGDFTVGENLLFSNDAIGTLQNLEGGLGDYTSDSSLLNTQGAVLHDGFFYQSFSYVLKAGEPSYDEIADNKDLLAALGIGVWSWREIVRKILHPAGLLLFSEFAINTRLSTRQIDLDTFIRLVIWSVFQVVVSEKHWAFLGLQTQVIERQKVLNEFGTTIPVFSGVNFTTGMFNTHYQRTIPHGAEKRADTNMWVSEYRHKPTGSKTLPTGHHKTQYEGVYWDQRGSETSIDAVETILGGGQAFTFDAFLEGDLAKRRTYLTGDSYIYTRNVS